MSNERAGLLEYEKTVDLFMSEGRIAWELVSIWMVLQVGLGSAIVLLHVQRATWGSIGYSILFSAGAISSLAWGFMQFRSKIWRENWLLYGLRLERELNARDMRLNLFEFEHRVRKKRIALGLVNNEIRERNQRWYEEIGALRLAHWGMFVLAIVWFIFLLLNLLVQMN